MNEDPMERAMAAIRDMYAKHIAFVNSVRGPVNFYNSAPEDRKRDAAMIALQQISDALGQVERTP